MEKLWIGDIYRGRWSRRQHTCQSPCSPSCSTFAQVLLRSLSLTATRTRTLSCLWDPHSHRPILPCLHLLSLIKFVNQLTLVQLRIRPKGPPAGPSMRNSSRISFAIAHVFLVHVRSPFSRSHLLCNMAPFAAIEAQAARSRGIVHKLLR